MLCKRGLMRPAQLSVSRCLLLFSCGALAIAVLALTVLASASQAFAAGGADLRIQITDQNGMPIRNAVVEVHPAALTPRPIRFPWRMGMAQKGQAFVPGTLVVARGSTVAFPNLDKVRHSIYSFSPAARFEIDLYGRDQTRTHTFTRTGAVKLGCNIHDDMRGYIRVTDTPHAGTTDRNGYLTLPGMNTGRARVTVWHPQLRAPRNEHRIEVMLADGAQTRKIGVRLR